MFFPRKFSFLPSFFPIQIAEFVIYIAEYGMEGFSELVNEVERRKENIGAGEGIFLKSRPDFEICSENLSSLSSGHCANYGFMTFIAPCGTLCI